MVGGTDPLGSLLQVITYVIILALCRPALRVNNPRAYDLANHKSVILLAVLLTDQQKTLLNQKVILLRVKNEKIVEKLFLLRKYVQKP